MSTTETIKQQVAKAPEVHPLKTLLEKSVKEIGRALPSGMNPERVVRIALTCVSQNPKLAECTPESFVGSLLVLAQLGLEPINGRAYLLPFNNKRKVGNEWKTFKEVQCLVGYKGLADLFYRHEAALSLDFQVVCANDHFDFQYGTSPYLNHKPAMKERGEVIGYYACARLRGNASLFRYMDKESCMEHGRTHSKTYVSTKYVNGVKTEVAPHFDENSPWHTDPDSMCLKTVLIQLSKLLPLSVELQKAISIDETSRDWREGVSNVIDLQSTTAWKEEGGEQEIPKVAPKVGGSIE